MAAPIFSITTKNTNQMTKFLPISIHRSRLYGSAPLTFIFQDIVSSLSRVMKITLDGLSLDTGELYLKSRLMNLHLSSPLRFIIDSDRVHL